MRYPHEPHGDCIHSVLVSELLLSPLSAVLGQPGLVSGDDGAELLAQHLEAVNLKCTQYTPITAHISHRSTYELLKSLLLVVDVTDVGVDRLQLPLHLLMEIRQSLVAVLLGSLLELRGHHLDDLDGGVPLHLLLLHVLVELLRKGKVVHVHQMTSDLLTSITCSVRLTSSSCPVGLV